MPSPPEGQLWRDAYRIAYIGASNPKGVRHTMVEHLKTFGSGHPAVRAIQGHLAFLEVMALAPKWTTSTKLRSWENY